MSTSSLPAWLIPRLSLIQGLTIETGLVPATVSVRFLGSRPVRFAVKNILVLSREKAAEIMRASQAAPSGRRREGCVLIATRELAEPMRERLRAGGISWVERQSGSCRLVGPGLLVDLTGRPSDAGRSSESIRGRLRDKSGLLAEILLQLKPGERFSLVEIANRGGVSTALSSRILQRLTHMKVTRRTGAGPVGYWQVVDPGTLLDLWVSEERSRPASSTSLYVWSRSPAGLYGKLSKLNEAAEFWALGGTSAANLYAPTLTTYPDPTVWVTHRVSVKDIAQALGGEIVDKGANMQIWQSETDTALQHSIERRGVTRITRLRLVSKARAYLESIAGPGRSAEVAQNLRETILPAATLTGYDAPST